MYKVIIMQNYDPDEKYPIGEFTWMGDDETEKNVIKDLNGFIKQITKEWPKLKTVVFDVDSAFHMMHPKKFNKWFRDGILKKYSEKKGYKISWVDKTRYSIDLK